MLVLKNSSHRRSNLNLKEQDKKLIIGCSEWCALPQLGIPAIKAKIDTGAKTSAIHALNVVTFYIQGKRHVHFTIPPLQHRWDILLECTALVIDERYVMSSNGQQERRYVIETMIEIANRHWKIQLTLSNRDPLTFRMLLGREALNRRVIVDPSHAFKQGRIDSQTVQLLYAEDERYAGI